MAYAGLYLLLGLSIFFLMNKIGVIESEFNEAKVWARNLCFVASSLVLVKVILLPPALIIVRDCGVVSAVMSIGQFKLFSAREPLVLFVILQAITYLAGVLAPVYESQASSRYLYTVVFSLLSALITLTVSVSTVRFITRYMPYRVVNIFNRREEINPTGQNEESEP